MADFARLEFECESCEFIVRMNRARYELDTDEIATILYPADTAPPIVMNVMRSLDQPCPQCEGALTLRSARYL